MEGLFGFILLRCSSYILQTPGREMQDFQHIDLQVQLQLTVHVLCSAVQYTYHSIAYIPNKYKNSSYLLTSALEGLHLVK